MCLMCLMCQGWTLGEVLDLHRRVIERHGWSTVYVEAGGHPIAFGYTVGLTRYHGHPEIVVGGLDAVDGKALLNALGAQVRDGVWFSPGDLFEAEGGHRIQMVEVDDPARLVYAQAIYAGSGAPVPALQAVWSDPGGHWPWQPGWWASAGHQPLFGHPLHHA